MAAGAGLLLTITVRSAAVRVVAEAGRELAVRKGHIEADGAGRWRVESDHSSVEVECPEGTSLAIANTSGRVECRGEFGDVRITTSSGRVEIDRATEVDVRTTSGRVAIEDCTGSCTIRTTSSRVEVGHAGDADVATTSGRITLHEVTRLNAQSVSGSIHVTARASPDLSIRTMSAGVDVTLAPGSTPATDLRSTSGKVRTTCPSGHDGQVDVETGSGSITVRCR